MRTASGLNNIDVEEYRAFIDSVPQAGIFQTREMCDSLARDAHYQPGVVVYLENDRITGALAWAIRREYSGLPGKITARSVVLGGPVMAERDPGVLSALIEGYLAQVKHKAVYSEFRNLFDLSWAWPEFEKKGFVREPHMNYLIDLTKSQDQLMMAMSQSRRKMLRRAMKKGELSVKEVSSTEDIREFHRLVQVTYGKVKKPFPDLSHFTGAKEILGDSAACFLCFKNGKAIASRFVFCFKGLVYDWYAGSDPVHNTDNPNEFIVWEILNWARERGYDTFDFGGGGNPEKPYGPREFKRRFGGEKVRYDRFVLVHRPLTMKLAKLGFHIKQRTGFF